MTENETAKPRVEVVEETQETLELLDLDRQPRPQKMARELRAFEGAHEARFVEREFIPRRKETLDDVRAAVDALEITRAEFPELRAPEPLPPEPEAEPEPPAPEVPTELRIAIEPLVSGPLRRAEVLHREGEGHVVEAAWEEPDGATATGLFVVTHGAARPFDDIAARIDALPDPTPSAPAPAAAPVVAEEPAAAEPAPADAPAADAASPTPEVEAPAKKGGLLGRFGRKKDAAEPAPEPTAEVPVEAPEEKPKRKLLGRFGGGKKDAKEEAPAEAAPPADEAAAAPDAEPPAKKRFSLRRK